MHHENIKTFGIPRTGSVGQVLKALKIETPSSNTTEGESHIWYLFALWQLAYVHFTFYTRYSTGLYLEMRAEDG